MRPLVSLLLFKASLMVSCAGNAQDALDRVDPSRVEERKVDQLGEKPREASGVATPLDAAPAQSEPLHVGAIEIVGLTELSNADFSDIVQQFIGRSLSAAQVSELVDKVAARARRRFPLATARILPQDILGGLLRVHVEEGRVDGVDMDGLANRRVKSILDGLITGRPVTAAELERALLLSRDLHGLSIREATIRRENERNILAVKGSYARFRGRLTIDNDTTKPIGPFEALGYAEANGVLAHDDTLQAYVLLALPQPEELGFLRLRYAKHIDNSGTEIFLAASYSKSEPGSYLAPLAITGESRWASLGLMRPLARSARSSLWLEGSLSLRELRQDRVGSPSRLDRLSVARLRLAGTASAAGGILRSSVTASQGLKLLEPTAQAGTVASRPDADGTFTAVLLAAQWTKRIAGPWGLAAAIRTQLASQPLLVSEEIGLGGASFARGYDYSERSGDQGTMGYLEMSYDIDRDVGPFDGLKPYAFVDGGVVNNLGRGRGGGTLYSAGGGIRLDVDRWTDAAFEIAAPLSGIRYETASKAPRIRLSLTRHF